jgi:hypothetical protein
VTDVPTEASAPETDGVAGQPASRRERLEPTLWILFALLALAGFWTGLVLVIVALV